MDMKEAFIEDPIGSICGMIIGILLSLMALQFFKCIILAVFDSFTEICKYDQYRDKFKDDDK